MKYDAEKALDLIPDDLLGTVKLVNISYRCWCDKVHNMPSLTTEKICVCGHKIASSRNLPEMWLNAENYHWDCTRNA